MFCHYASTVTSWDCKILLQSLVALFFYYVDIPKESQAGRLQDILGFS
jgi:hypothetical protein